MARLESIDIARDAVYAPPVRTPWLRVGILLAVACGDSGGRSDAAGDAAADAARDSEPRDGTIDVAVGPECPGGCGAGLRCCPLADGGTGCVNVANDPEHCGVCGRRCAEGRGTTCAQGSCVCGTRAEGCLGTEDSICCPPREEGGRPYCANLTQASDDCGRCNSVCDEAAADRCLAGRCVCGEGAEACAGTPEDTCCAAEFAQPECVDLTADRRHCGACGLGCQVGETCRGGACTVGDVACEGGCPLDEICCRGTCCARLLCGRGACDASPDAGTGDGGSDAGSDGGSDGG